MCLSGGAGADGVWPAEDIARRSSLRRVTVGVRGAAERGNGKVPTVLHGDGSTEEIDGQKGPGSRQSRETALEPKSDADVISAALRADGQADSS